LSDSTVADFHYLSIGPARMIKCLSEFSLLTAYIPLSSLASGFGGLGVSALASGTQGRGFKPSDFSGRKNPQRAFLRKVSKTVGPMSLIYGM
jgi:hypothetical protein